MNKDIESFLKDPKGYTKRRLEQFKARREDAQSYRDRQCKILDDLLRERIAEINAEERAFYEELARYAKEHEEKLSQFADGELSFWEWLVEEWRV